MKKILDLPARFRYWAVIKKINNYSYYNFKYMINSSNSFTNHN